MGHVAEKVMQISAVPVMLCKSNATRGVDSEQGMSDRRMRSSNDDAKLTIICAVDSTSHLSRACFDLSARFARPGDWVQVVHVLDSDKALTTRNEELESVGASAVAAYFKEECSKQQETKGMRIEYIGLPKRVSVRETLLERAESCLADIIVLGSVELTKSAPGESAPTACVCR